MYSEDQKRTLEIVDAQLSDMAMRDRGVDIDSFDRLRIFVDAEPQIFPPKFKELLSVHRLDVDAQRVECAMRLSSMLKAFRSLSEAQQWSLLGMPRPAESDLAPQFQLDAAEKDRMRELCADMRKIVWNSQIFDQPHRRRLLNRIAAIEAEVEKPQGMYDVVLGAVSDFGEAMGKFGTDIKPLTDRLREIAGIARHGTKEYDQLPAPDEVKQLPPPSDEEADS